MLTKRLLSFVLFFVSLFSVTSGHSQERDSLNEDSESTEIQNQITAISNQLAEIKNIMKNNVDDGCVEVGKLVVYEDSVPVKVSHGSGRGKIKIDSVIVLVKDGLILDVQVISGSNIFSNNAPISLTTRSFRKKEYQLFAKGGDNILLTDFLQFISVKPYIPGDDQFVLKPYDSKTFCKSVGLNSVLDLRLYTDALGVFGGKSNGLIQTDAAFKQLLHRGNIKKSGMFFMNYFKINLSASKFDSKVAFTDSSKFTRTSLFQKSWLNVDLSLNLFNGWLEKKTFSSWFIDLGAGSSLSDVAFEKDTSTITSPYIFIQAGIDKVVSDNIGATIYARIIKSYTPSINFDSQGGVRTFVTPTIGIFWNPPGNEGSRIFVRASYNVDTSDKKNNFMMLQFGYALKLSSVIK